MPKKVVKEENDSRIPQDEKLIQELLQELKIKDHSLSEEFSDYASKYFYWMTKHEDAKKTLEESRLAFDKYEAQLYSGKRKKMEEKDSKAKVTETQLKQLIREDTQWNERKKEMIYLEYLTGLFQVCVRAYATKSDMLISMGAHIRHEFDTTGMRIKDNG